jgi:hypothetical protein
MILVRVFFISDHGLRKSFVPIEINSTKENSVAIGYKYSTI